jgi:hypothetical protein
MLPTRPFPGDLVATFTGALRSTDSPSVETTTEMVIRFTSDGSVEAHGFEAEFVATNIEPSVTFAPNSPPPLPRIPVDEPSAAQWCERIRWISAMAGEISDGSGQHDYAPNTDCTWIIYPGGGSLSYNPYIHFWVSSITLQMGDFLKVYRGARPTAHERTSAELLASISEPMVIRSAANQITVHFETRSAASGGFRANFLSVSQTPTDVIDMPFGGTPISAATLAATTAVPNGRGCSGLQILQVPEGEISDGEGRYANGMICEWRIVRPQQEIRLAFSEFDLELGYDWVYIWDTLTADGMPIASLTSNELPGTISSRSGLMFIRFETDASVANSGFRASYVSESRPPIVHSTPLDASENGCEGTMMVTDPSGQIQLLGYEPSSLCEWIIIASNPSSHVKILVLSVDTEVGFDFVQVFEANRDRSRLQYAHMLFRQYNLNFYVNRNMSMHLCLCLLFRLLQEFSGEHHNQRAFTTSTSAAVIRFTSDATLQRNGFLVSFCTALPCANP